MAQRVRVDGFESDAPVAPLSEFAQALRKWVPELTPEEADQLLVSPPFELPRQFSDGEADAIAADLGRLGARIRLEPVEDPTWWRERDGDTAFLETPVYTAPPAASETETQVTEVEEKGFWEIWTEVVFHPSRFFASPLVREGGGNPLLFAIVFSLIGAVLAAPGNYVISGPFAGETSLATELLGAVVATPILTIMALFFFALSLHVAAVLLGGIGDFGVAWRIAAYASAIDVFQAVPVVGHALIFMLFFAYSVAGLQGAYRMTPTRAAIAAILPGFAILMLFAFLVLLILIVVGASDFQSFFQTMQANPSPQF